MARDGGASRVAVEEDARWTPIARRLRGALGWLALALIALALGCTRPAPPHRELLLAAAASLRAVLPELSRAYESTHPGLQIRATYGASGDLRRQVEGGAPIDAVVFASGKPVDDLIATGRVAAASRSVIATNQLVLIGPRGAKPLTFATLDAAPAGERIAIGDPGAVPAGQYAREALEKLGKWEAVRPRVVLAGDVGAVLAYVRRGEVAAGVVYRTELRGIDDVVVLDEARGSWAPHPEVVGAVVQGASGAAEAAAFLAFLRAPEGQKLLADFGFGPP